MSEIVAPSDFLDKTYNETVALLIEARNYLAFQESDDLSGRDTDDRLLVSQETMRVTVRLTQVMAWLFSRRAVQAGEVTEAEARAAQFALGGREVCLDDRWAADPRLPQRVRVLLDRTLSLYQRVCRLEEQIHARAAGG